jgi:hypothetical protein
VFYAIINYNKFSKFFFRMKKKKKFITRNKSVDFQQQMIAARIFIVNLNLIFFLNFLLLRLRYSNYYNINQSSEKEEKTELLNHTPEVVFEKAQ